MPIGWKSHYQQCKSTNYDEERERDSYLIATSSAESEIHAAHDAAKESLHLKHVLEELEIKTPEKVCIKVDAGAALGFISNTGNNGKMKHIDIRKEWVVQLRNRDQLKWVKVPGTENKADFFTKIQPTCMFKVFQGDMMSPLY